MKHVAVNTDYEYPIYIYHTYDDMPTHQSKEIHTLITHAGIGYCKNISCFKCPIKYECDENLSLLSKFFPELEDSNPEWFI